MTNRSIMFKDRKTQQDVQLIIYKFFPTIKDIFNDYDFTVNMGALDCKTETLELHENFLKHNSQKYLHFHTGTAYPIISALRVQKYVDKGYTISKSQMLRLLITISQLNIDSWETLKDNIGGMYGLNMDEVFPETEEFSIEKAISVLDEIMSDTKFRHYYESIEQEDIIKEYFTKYDDSRLYCGAKFFKNAKLKDDKLVSYYDEKFEYKVGESVNGGLRGIYCFKSYDVIGGDYYNKDDCVILELEPNVEGKIITMYNEKYQLMSDVKVIAQYTKTEFLRKYKDDESYEIKVAFDELLGSSQE